MMWCSVIGRNLIKKKEIKHEIVVYQTKTGAIELNRDMSADTVWATQMDIAEIFGSERLVITGTF